MAFLHGEGEPPVQLRKLSVDCIAAICTHCKEHLLDQKGELLAALEAAKNDKHLPVRTAAKETIKLLNTLFKEEEKQEMGPEVAGNKVEKDDLEGVDSISEI